VLAVAGLAWLGGFDSSNNPTDTLPPPVLTTIATTTTTTTFEPPHGTITVSVTGVEDAEGWQLAGFLYKGAGLSDPDNRAIGGFAARVGSNPFSTTRLVRQPADIGVGPFPYLGHDVLEVRPGTYTLTLWLGNRLISYRRQEDPDRVGLVACEASVEVGGGQDASVTVTGGFGDVTEGIPRCTVDPGPRAAMGTIQLSVPAMGRGDSF
jgi:hypothetical protein